MQFSLKEKITIILNFLVFSFLWALLALAVFVFSDPDWFGKVDAAGAPGFVAHANYPLLIGATIFGLVVGGYFAYRYAKKLRAQK